jgi:hypothetical protein
MNNPMTSTPDIIPKMQSKLNLIIPEVQWAVSYASVHNTII